MARGPSKKTDGAPDHVGHRARLRDKFLKAGPGGLHDYELLELLLFLANPRRDMKPLAKALLKKFGTFADVVSAPATELREVDGIGDGAVVAIKTAQATALELLRGGLMEKPVLGNWQQLMDYCRAAQAFDKTEHFRVLFLNQKNALIGDEVQQTGTVNHTPVYPREVVKRALEIGATAIIMVHNHPSGDATPSAGDISMTAEVQAACRSLGIVLHDHIIVTRDGFTSFKTEGLL